MQLKRLDHHQAHDLASALPDGFLDIIEPITAKEGHAYKMPSLTDTTTFYKCAVVRHADGWYGKCECIGWPRTNETDAGKKPCKHLAAALILQNDFDPDEAFPQPQQEVNPFSDKPIAQDVPDASPLTHSQAVVQAAPQAGSLVRPVATIQETRAAFRAFQDAKIGLLEKTDFQQVYDGRFIKKSGWRKIAVFFGLSLQKISERDIATVGIRSHEVTYRAIAPGGQFQDATAWCSWDEAMGSGRVAAANTTAKKQVKAGKWTDQKANQYVKGQTAKLEHDIRATAETRAKSRAISDLVGGGEVSAEEMKLAGTWKD